MAETTKYSAADWARTLFATVVLCFGPFLALNFFGPPLPLAYEHTGWFIRALLAVPATLLCGLLLWPPVWLVCRRSQAAWIAAMFAAIYTPVTAFLLVGYLNVVLDRDPGRRVTVQYVRFEPRSKGPSVDVVTSWEDPRSTISLKDTLLRQNERVAGSAISVTVHRGWLGLEWVDGVQAP